eukprot:CAMPEP_0194534142 /NCGR_PEP_ID=MMETSP0253-20130528/72210_1 /TAXON_ID=2966 /ORGANISM="Noctiluca scintillans" /LENGTH=53 /DNA_ID=CAMNT_0039379769 /DNA_START=196 /DNA_END=357 /DNA_ORIENTATION=+
MRVVSIRLYFELVNPMPQLGNERRHRGVLRPTAVDGQDAPATHLEEADDGPLS